MFTEEELLASPAFWLDTTQNELFRVVSKFQKKNKLSKKQLAVALDCSERTVGQLLNGNINCSMEQLINISLKMGKAPHIKFKPLK